MDTTVTIKKAIVPLLKKHGIIKAGVFGSHARGDMNEESDIDLIVQFEKGRTLFDLVELKEEIKKNQTTSRYSHIQFFAPALKKRNFSGTSPSI